MQKKYIFVQNPKQYQKTFPRRNQSLMHPQKIVQIPKIQITQPHKNNQQKFKYFVGLGNNSDLVRRILSHRTNWIQTTDPKSPYINFKWQQTNKGYRYDNNSTKKGFQQLLNHFQFHQEISNKQYMLRNLMQYCQHLKKNAFEIVPPTFILNLNQSSFDTNLNLFLKFFQNNLPDHLKKQNRKFWLSLKRKSSNNMTQTQKKYSIYFYCKPFLSQVFLAKNSNYIWMLKPTFLNRGRGIHVFTDLNSLESLINSYVQGHQQNNFSIKKIEQYQHKFQTSKIIKLQQPITSIKQINNTIGNSNIIKASSFVLQKYIQKPLLISGRKFDIRVWVLWSHDYKIYFFKQGYLRTSSQQYKTDSNSLVNPFVHLTNNAIQKNNKSYSKHQAGNQLPFRNLEDIFMKYGYNFHDMIKNMKQIIVHTVLSVKKKINRLDRSLCFEIFGYDFMIDETSKLWLIQINTNPCIEQSSPLLEKLLPRMLDDGFKLTLDKIYGDNEQDGKGSRYVISNYENKQNLWQFLIDLRK